MIVCDEIKDEYITYCMVLCFKESDSNDTGLPPSGEDSADTMQGFYLTSCFGIFLSVGYFDNYHARRVSCVRYSTRDTQYINISSCVYFVLHKMTTACDIRG